MINEIMSKNIISCNSNSSIKECAEKMKKHNIGFIPIKDNDEYVGVITDRDIALSIINMKDKNDTIKSYISHNIISIEENSSIDDALTLMKINKVKRLLIKKGKDFIGVLSLSDILNYSSDKSIIETYKIIFKIDDNGKYDNTEIDEFYL